MKALVLALLTTTLLAACGVTAQDEPQPLTTSTADPAATPTLTQRPDRTTSSSPTPTPTTTPPHPSTGP